MRMSCRVSAIWKEEQGAPLVSAASVKLPREITEVVVLCCSPTDGTCCKRSRSVELGWGGLDSSVSWHGRFVLDSALDNPLATDPKSMVNLLAPTSGHPVVQHRAHPPRLFQNRFLDLDDVHSVDSEAHRKHDDAVYRVVEDYCRDRNPARSLRVDFETYGWDFNRLEEGGSFLPRAISHGI